MKNCAWFRTLAVLLVGILIGYGVSYFVGTSGQGLLFKASHEFNKKTGRYEMKTVDCTKDPNNYSGECPKDDIGVDGYATGMYDTDKLRLDGDFGAKVLDRDGVSLVN